MSTPDLASSHFADLLNNGWRDMSFKRFRPGVEICELIKANNDQEPALALLRYEPGATVPRHRHRGMETIIVLEGEQQDERGVYACGSVVVNTPDSIHSVQAPKGCVVLIHWDRPIEILNPKMTEA